MSISTSGVFRIGAASSVMAAGLAGGAPIYSFRWGVPTTPNLKVALRRIRISAGDTSAAFTAGTFTFQLIIARSFTASDSSGTGIAPVNNDGKLNTLYAKSQIADLRIASTAALTAGTRTLDAQALSSLTTSDQATAGNSILAPIDMFTGYAAGEQPIILASNEGFVIAATVPATGTWSFSVETNWEEAVGF
jgi:hypothetical protein